LLPLDDCLYALRATIPKLSRSSLHRCLERLAISRLPEVEGDKFKRQKLAPCPIGSCLRRYRTEWSRFRPLRQNVACSPISLPHLKGWESSAERHLQTGTRIEPGGSANHPEPIAG
jgi:hypothetical protein